MRSTDKVRIFIVLSFLLFAVYVCGRIDTEYTVEAEITNLEGYTYTAVDVTGFEWVFEHDMLFPVGTDVELRVFHAFSSSKWDDSIKDVKTIK